jgi:osmotically-inducible protein OsmY
MKTDTEIKKDINAELKWDSRLNGSNVEVDVNGGHVILSGSVSSYPRKISAEESVRRIAGVKSVSNELKVSIPSIHFRTDSEIKKAILDTIKWNSSIAEDQIAVKVEDGQVELTGNVNWEYQRSKARLLAEDITGVVGVTNLINVKSNSANSQDVKSSIDAALRRNYYLDTNKIKVEVDAGKVILTGKVKTLAEKGAAETAAWSAPGITEVVNELVIDYSEVFA